MNPEQWLSLKWNGGSTMSDRWLNQSKIIHLCSLLYIYLILFYTFCNYSFISMILDYFITLPILRQSKSHCRLETILIKMLNGNDFFI